MFATDSVVLFCLLFSYNENFINLISRLHIIHLKSKIRIENVNDQELPTNII